MKAIKATINFQVKDELFEKACGDYQNNYNEMLEAWEAIFNQLVMDLEFVSVHHSINDIFDNTDLIDYRFEKADEDNLLFRM